MNLDFFLPPYVDPSSRDENWEGRKKEEEEEEKEELPLAVAYYKSFSFEEESSFKCNGGKKLDLKCEIHNERKWVWVGLSIHLQSTICREEFLKNNDT